MLLRKLKEDTTRPYRTEPTPEHIYELQDICLKTQLQANPESQV